MGEIASTFHSFFVISPATYVWIRSDRKRVEENLLGANGRQGDNNYIFRGHRQPINFPRMTSGKFVLGRKDNHCLRFRWKSKGKAIIFSRSVEFRINSRHTKDDDIVLRKCQIRWQYLTCHTCHSSKSSILSASKCTEHPTKCVRYLFHGFYFLFFIRDRGMSR